MGSLSRGTKADQFSYVPAGTVLPFAGDTAPAGWAICNGSIVSRSEYPELFLAIGEAWGNGDGSTTFHLPDMRGRFLRGTDNTAGRDPDAGARTASNMGGNSGDAVGSVQNYEFESHTHTGNGVSRGGNAGAGRTLSVGDNSNFGSYVPSVKNSGGNETRPINANMNYIIKL